MKDDKKNRIVREMGFYILALENLKQSGAPETVIRDSDDCQENNDRFIMTYEDEIALVEDWMNQARYNGFNADIWDQYFAEQLKEKWQEELTPQNKLMLDALEPIIGDKNILDFVQERLARVKMNKASGEQIETSTEDVVSDLDEADETEPSVKGDTV